MPKETTNISVFQKKLERVSKSLRPQIVSVLNTYGAMLLEDFKYRSAVDTGRYQRNWRFLKASASSKSKFRIVLKNATEYAPVLIQGADIGGAPWYFPKNKSKKNVSSPSGKLFVDQPRGAFGRWLKGTRRAVWAGGKNPGKARAVGGVKAGLFADETFQKEFMADLKKAMIGGF